MILLVLGTVAEQQQGLYYAQTTYFSVYFFYLFDIIPLPGTYTILTIMFINLLCKLIVDNWHTRKLGSLVTHISGLLLLVGGFITAHYSFDGYIELNNNQISNYISDYHRQELLISLNNKNIIINHQDITNKKIIPLNDLGIDIQIQNYCKHCKLENNIHDSKQPQLTKLPKPKDNEQEHSILQIDLVNQNSKQKINTHNIYISLNHATPYTIKSVRGNADINFRSQRTELPFKIKLNKFDAEFYPESNIAKSYSSNVALSSDHNNMLWQGTISMNNPLRYKGYTFYQSSYYVNNNEITSVLAVVFNIGQSFPYIASIVLCIGILVHLTQRLPKLIKKQ